MGLAPAESTMILHHGLGAQIQMPLKVKGINTADNLFCRIGNNSWRRTSGLDYCFMYDEVYLKGQCNENGT